MKNLSLFCLYRLLKRKPGDIYRFNALIRQFYRFGRHDFPQRCSFLIRDEIQYNQLFHQCRRYKSNLFDAVK